MKKAAKSSPILVLGLIWGLRRTGGDDAAVAELGGHAQVVGEQQARGREGEAQLCSRHELGR